MAKKTRRRFTPEKKFNIVKQVLGKARTFLEVSEVYGIHPNQYYSWQTDFFEAALNGFARNHRDGQKLPRIEH